MTPENDSNKRGRALEFDTNTAVIISAVGRNNSFVANLGVEILIEQIADASEDAQATLEKPHFSGQIPNGVGGDKVRRCIICVGKRIVHHLANQAYFHRVFPPVDAAQFDVIIGGISGVEPFTRTGRKFGIEQGNVAIEIELAAGTFGSAVQHRKKIDLNRGFESGITGVPHILRGGESYARIIYAGDFSDLIVHFEIESTEVEGHVRERFAA